MSSSVSRVLIERAIERTLARCCAIINSKRASKSSISAGEWVVLVGCLLVDEVPFQEPDDEEERHESQDTRRNPRQRRAADPLQRGGVRRTLLQRERRSHVVDSVAP